MNLFLLNCVLILAHSAETILGFGATLIALALGVHLFPREKLFPVLVIVALLQSLWLASRWFRDIQWRILLRHVLPMSGVGTLVGIWCRGLASESLLRVVLGTFIAVVSSMELVYLFTKNAPRDELPRYYGIPLLFVGGIFHGLFASGGPLIVYYASRQMKTPQGFRATLSTLWLILNTTLLISLLMSRQVCYQTLEITGLVLPGLVIGITLGSTIRVKEFFFKVMTYALLFFGGLALLIG